MTIGLIDVDGHNFPNLALMKLSGYHRIKAEEERKMNVPATVWLLAGVCTAIIMAPLI